MSSNSLSSAEILYTPNFHCELASKGIAHSWGASKSIYRYHLINEKRSATNFEKLVKVYLSQVTIDMARWFSSNARDYMLTYKHKESVEADTHVECSKKNKRYTINIKVFETQIV